MAYFPMCVDLTGKLVYVIGSGPQAEQKAQVLRPFGPQLRQQGTFTQTDAEEGPALVVVGDLPLEEAEKIVQICRRYGIAVNVVDVPQLCSFYFPSLVTRGPLTVSVSSGGGCPAGAAYLRRRVEQALPEHTEQVLLWLTQQRQMLRQRGILKNAVEMAFAMDRPLTQQELAQLQKQMT